MKNKSSIKKEKRVRRHKRIRSRVSGTASIPRLAVFRSNKYIYAQLIDDVSMKTLTTASSLKVKGKGMVEKAKEVGKEIAKKGLALKVKKVVFDRGGFIYTGKIKALSDGAREGGLIF